VACDDERRRALVVRGLPFGQIHDLRARSICLDRLDALLGTGLSVIPLAGGDDLAVGCLEVGSNASTLEASSRMVVEVADLLRVLGNINAVPADLTSMMMRRLIWFIVLSFSFAFIVTAAAGPVVSVVACAGVLIYALAVARGDAAHRAEAAEAQAAEAEIEAEAAAAEAVIVEAEAVIAAARLRLLGEAGS
jgi:hypothetical protein